MRGPIGEPGIPTAPRALDLVKFPNSPGGFGGYENDFHDPQFSRTDEEKRIAQERYVETVAEHCRGLSSEEWRKVKEAVDTP